MGAVTWRCVHMYIIAVDYGIPVPMFQLRVGKDAGYGEDPWCGYEHAARGRSAKRRTLTMLVYRICSVRNSKKLHTRGRCRNVEDTKVRAHGLISTAQGECSVTLYQANFLWRWCRHVRTSLVDESGHRERAGVYGRGAASRFFDACAACARRPSS